VIVPIPVVTTFCECHRFVGAERHQSPGGDEKLSIVKTPDFAARVHWIVRHCVTSRTSRGLA
jgi:hypothetical protein